jgi:hypothetical protein
LSNRGAVKQPATAGGKSTFAKHRNTNSIAGAAALGAVNKSMELKQPGLAKANSHLKEPGSALSKRSSLSGQAGLASGRGSNVGLSSRIGGAKKAEEAKKVGTAKLADPQMYPM